MRIQIGPFLDTRYYEASGLEYFNYLKRSCNIQPTDCILDLGCGYGQLAAPLSKYLNSNGRYYGFDISRSMIDWCTKNISPKLPNFRFQLADVFNSEYNPKGKQKASEYKFPFKNETFDIVFLKSVFTHMLPKDLNNYLAEISRILKKNGNCLISYFLINPDVERLIKSGQSSLSFRYSLGDARVNNYETPEIAVAYNEEYIRRLYAHYKLTMAEPIKYGSWCGRKKYLSYQDITNARKE